MSYDKANYTGQELGQRKYGLELDFEGLTTTSYEIVSKHTCAYNCHAFAMGDFDRKWGPISHYWPKDCPRQPPDSLPIYLRAFATRGFEPCGDGDPELGYEKIAVYANDSGPSHTAKQVPSGKWASKMGDDVDIEHDLHALEGHYYGRIVQFMRRPVS
jgi:hypothetical protein